MTDSTKIHPATERLFEATLQKVRDQFEIKRKDTGVGLKLLSRFDELKNYQSLYVHKVTEFKGETGLFIILLIEKHQTIIERKRNVTAKREIEEIEPVMIFSIPHDIGRAFIRKETLADKVVDLFTKVDIDFAGYPNFSKNYYVVGENPAHVKQHFPGNLMEALNNVEDMTIEINGNWGLLRTEKNLTENVLLLLLSIGYKMTK